MFCAGLLAGSMLVSCDYVATGLTPLGDGWRSEAGLDIPIDRETGKPLLEQARVTYRATGLDSFGPDSRGLSTSTSVWTVNGRWYHVTDEAGMAWEANSGLTWDQKYSAWVDSLEKVSSTGSHMTVQIVTPYGVELASPRLECA